MLKIGYALLGNGEFLANPVITLDFDSVSPVVEVSILLADNGDGGGVFHIPLTGRRGYGIPVSCPVHHPRIRALYKEADGLGIACLQKI